MKLNPNRYVKRRTPYPFENVNTPFDEKKFNFNKIQDAEVDQKQNQFYPSFRLNICVDSVLSRQSTRR